MLLIAEMLIHLDLETGLEDLLGEIGQQPVGADEVLALSACSVDELFGQRLIRPLLTHLLQRCRHRHIMV